MSKIGAADVARLRKTTGAGMMDCKKALEESGGDFDKAIEIIRKKGQALASKRADREAGEGVVLAGTSSDNSFGVVVTLNCETDFVAKNEDFTAFARTILDKAIESDIKTLSELKTLTIDGRSVEERVVEQVGVIGEKVELSSFERLDAPHVQSYIHPGNRLATIVGFSVAGVDEQVYKDVAMQIAAMSPVAVDEKDVPASVLEQEREIGREQARREGKPEQIIDKIAEGKLRKFFKENTLLNQDFVKDNKLTIREYLRNSDDNLTVTAFIRFSLTV